MPAFNFLKLSLWNDLEMYLKQSPSLSRVLTNCFINPSLIWSGGRMFFSLSTNGSLMMFAAPTVMFSFKGHVTFSEWSCPTIPHADERRVLRVSTLLQSRSSPSSDQHKKTLVLMKA